MKSTSPLPSSWIDEIFRRLHGTYGSMWIDKWRIGQMLDGEDVGILNAKQEWAKGLSGFRDCPERIAKSIELCKAKKFPPTLPEFIEMCRQQHLDIKSPQLENKYDIEKAKKNLEKIKWMLNKCQLN